MKRANSVLVLLLATFRHALEQYFLSERPRKGVPQMRHLRDGWCMNG